MNIWRSSRLQNLVQSDIRTMTRECVAVGGINLGQGVATCPAPWFVTQQSRLSKIVNLYSYPEGIVEIRELIAEKFERDNSLRLTPTNKSP